MNCCDGCPFCDKSQVRPRTAMELLGLVKQLQRELDYIRIAVEYMADEEYERTAKEG